MDSIIDFLIQVKDFLNPKALIDYMLALLGNYVYFGLFFVIFASFCGSILIGFWNETSFLFWIKMSRKSIF